MVPTAMPSAGSLARSNTWRRAVFLPDPQIDDAGSSGDDLACQLPPTLVCDADLHLGEPDTLNLRRRTSSKCARAQRA